MPLPQPRGYFGAEAIFGNGWVNEDGTDNDGYDVVRRIPDREVDDVRPPRAKDAQQHWRANAPDSLRAAIEWFVLATAARRVRLGETKPSSMLVHTTMSAQSHFEGRDACASVIRDLKASLSVTDHALPDRLRATWDMETTRVPAGALGHRPLAFDAVWNELPNVLHDLGPERSMSSSTGGSRNSAERSSGTSLAFRR